MRPNNFPAVKFWISCYCFILAFSSVCLAENPDGLSEHVSLGKVTEKFVYQGLPIAVGHAYFYDSGELAMGWLAEDSLFNGIAVKGKEPIHFYKSGRLSSAVLSKDQVIQGFSLMGNKTISLYESGKLKDGWLKENISYQGITFAGNQKISLFESGFVIFGTLGDNLKINNIEAKAGELVIFYESGALKEVVAKGDAFSDMFKGDKNPSAAYISFYESGKLQGKKYDHDMVFQGITFRPSYIEFYESGWVQKGVVKNSFTYKGVFFKRESDWSPVVFYENGNIKYLLLEEDVVINGNKYHKGTFLDFADSEKLEITTKH